MKMERKSDPIQQVWFQSVLPSLIPYSLFLFSEPCRVLTSKHRAIERSCALAVWESKQSEPNTSFSPVSSVITDAGGNPLEHAAEDKVVEREHGVPVGAAQQP